MENNWEGTLTFNDHDTSYFFLGRWPVAAVTPARHFNAVRHQILFAVHLVDGPFQGDDDLRPLFHPFFLTLLNDQGVGVTHHSDQHVQQQYRNHNHENDKHGGCHSRVNRVLQWVVLKLKSKKEIILYTLKGLSIFLHCSRQESSEIGPSRWIKSC